MGRQDQHLQIFPILSCCLKHYSSQTKHVCGPPVCNFCCLSVLLCLSPPELHSRLSWHVIWHVISCPKTNNDVCLCSWLTSKSKIAKHLQFINKGGTWATFPLSSTLRTQCHHRRTTLIYSLGIKSYESAQTMHALG